MKKIMTIVTLMVSTSLWAGESGSYFDGIKKVDENIWIGPQPTQNDFNEFAAQEVSAVINTRTQPEMNQLEFNEAEELKKFEIDYGLVEIGKGHEYSPAKLSEFNELMVANQGKKMVLHCRSGHRASQLYAAWLIKYQGKTSVDALKAIQSDDTELTDSIKALLGQ